ncbi:hypothetical protein [uncultured Brachyspira sp.]|uniref:DUF6985 domain-containing protein n=1 Tax=uncultured Brachyspira sp. TaxID=221953 RepID=UPI0027DBC288|nr:hypothetical protein [uncultured Brachyspira sp.]
MVKKCEDAIFGEMIYKHSWQKTETINIFGKKFNIVIAAKSYSEKPITKEQQNSYKNFKKNEIKILDKVSAKINEYINSNKEWILNNLDNNIKLDLLKLLTPKTLLFNQNGDTILLFDCVWDEHGIGIDITSGYKIGSQDIFL